MAHPPPVPTEIDEIAAISDPVLRNLRITEAYHRLALALPCPRPGANWCAFAVWASRQAGQTIRGEDLMRALERALKEDRDLAAVVSGGVGWAIRSALEHPGTRRWRILELLGQEAFGRAADALARGNRKVFSEIAREFARFLPLCGTLPIPEERLVEFLRDVPTATDPGSRDLLRRAFRHLASALVEPDRGKRAELMLLANLEIAHHEQARVQPEIQEALEAPYTSTSQLGRVLLEALAPGSPHWSPMLRRPLSMVVGAGGRVAEVALRALLRRLITESMITLSLPEGVLKLGRQLAGLPPECLREPQHEELRAMLARLTPRPGDLDGAGADDWSLFQERMIAIGSFFRLRHEDASLYSPPFTTAQVEALRAGRLPDGRL
jgi:HEPN domain-containing protein